MNYSSLLILGVFFIVALYFIFKRKKVTYKALSSKDQQRLNANVAYYERLGQAKKRLFEQKVSVFLATIRIEGVGLTVERLDELLIASSAVIPIFGFEDWTYKNLSSIVLYPATFSDEFQFEGEKREIMGMVGSGFMNGQMILSRAALRQGFSAQAGQNNTGIHEFVHLLDKADGAMDGVPSQLMAYEYALPWLKMMHAEMTKIATNQSEINPYALTNEAEFFAVVAAYFFEDPDALKVQHPEVYAALKTIFAQDPAN